jgi:dihydrofolate synthase/folylpolyglutamate synthase
VRGWSERIQVDGADADIEAALARVRPHAAGATQFEVITAAAFAEFAARGVGAAVIEAGLGGRLDATNVLDAPVALLTNVGLEHTDVLGETREKIAAEKLAVARPGATVVLPDGEWRGLVPQSRIVIGGAREAAGAFVGHPIDADVDVAVPGRFERRGPDEVRDGAHTPEAVEWLLARLEPREWTLVVSILRDKDADAMLSRLAGAGRTLVATRSSNARALDERELAARAAPYFEHVDAVADPAQALARAHLEGPVLVTGSLYLLADLHDSR